MSDPLHSPATRNLVHAGVFFVLGVPMLLLARSGWPPHFGYWAAGFMACGIFVNLFALPRFGWGKRIRREGEGWYSGIALYPAALAVCFLAFPLYAVFAAWAVLACGDAPASFFGRAAPRYKLPWNEHKSFAGLIAFMACAFCGAYLSLWLLPCPLFLKADGAAELPYVWTLAVLAAAAGALAESLDTELDDNVRVPFAVALVLLLAAHFLSASTRSLPAATHVQPELFIHALIANGVLGGAVLLYGVATLPATLAGMALGVLIYFYAHWQGYLLFALFVGLGSGLSKVGLKRKLETRTAEANGGKRGVGNVMANLLVPALCCAAYPLSGGRASLLMAFAGALAAALADTASSEIGVLSRKQPFLLTNFKPVPPGTNGAISILGTCAALAASALIAITATISGFVQLAAGSGYPLTLLHQIAAAGLLFWAGVLGTFVDSLLGATVEDKLPGVRKGAVNFACTLTGAMLAGTVTEIWLWLK